MPYFETVWSFSTARFNLYLEAAPEPDPDLSWDDTGETQENIADGTWTNYLFRVRLEMDGIEIATDYLGNSIYANASDFRDHLGIKKLGENYGSYFAGMVRHVCIEARQIIRNNPKLRSA